MNFVEISTLKGTCCVRVCMEHCPYFLRVLSTSIKSGTGDVHTNLLNDSEFCEDWHSESHSVLVCKHEFTLVLSTCLVCLKFSVRDFSVMLLGICESRENWHREGSSFLMGINEIKFMNVWTSFSVSHPELYCSTFISLLN